MTYLTNTFSSLIHQFAFFFITFGNLIIIAMALLFLYLAIARGFEPSFLVPIAFGMFLVNIYPDIMLDPAKSADGSGELLYYFYQLDEWGILPSLIFMDVDAMTNFGPLITNPTSFLLGTAAQLGIYAAYLLVVLLGFNGEAAATISTIGGAGGPTSIFLANKTGQSEYLGTIAVTAYFYMSLAPIIRPPVMRLPTIKKECRVRMAQLRPVSKLERTFFPIVVMVIVSLLLPTVVSLVSMLMLGNLFHESSVVGQLTDATNNALVYIVVILLGTSVGATTNTKASLKADTLKIVFLGSVAFAFGTAAGVLFGKLMCKLTSDRVNPPIGSVGVLAMPMSARASQKIGAEADPTNFLLMHTVGPNVAGVIDAAMAIGTFVVIFGVK